MSLTGGAFVPGASYDRTGATETGLTLKNPVTISAPYSETAAVTLTPSVSGRRLALNNSAGLTVTLPPATGSGAEYVFVVGTTAATGSYVIQVASATDYLRGFCLGVTDTAGTAMAWATANTGTVATESDTITMNGTTQGGRLGDQIRLYDLAKAVWSVAMFNVGSGAEATPFSAAV